MKIKKVSVAVSMAIVFVAAGMITLVYAGLGDWIKSEFGGCYKQSQVLEKTCNKAIEKKIKEGGPDALNLMINADKICMDQAKNVLLNCRKSKGKLKTGMDGAKLDAELSSVQDKEVACRKEVLMKCGSEHLTKGQAPTADQQAKFKKCADTALLNCTTEAIENQIMEKYISTEPGKK